MSDDVIQLSRKWSVEIAVDPGYASAYCVLAITWNRDQVYVFDEVYRQHAVVEEIIDECMQRDWWRRVTGGVIDVAGQQHQAQDSQVEVWARRGILSTGRGIGLRANRVRIEEGISRHRTFLINPFGGKPRLFHDPRCKRTIQEYGEYKYREVIEGRPIKEEPVDANNHAMKALAYWLWDRFGATDDTYQRLKKKQYNRMNLDARLRKVFGG